MDGGGMEKREIYILRVYLWILLLPLPTFTSSPFTSPSFVPRIPKYEGERGRGGRGRGGGGIGVVFPKSSLTCFFPGTEAIKIGRLLWKHVLVSKKKERNNKTKNGKKSQMTMF